MISPQTYQSQFVRNCVLFFRKPVDFLLTFDDPLDKIPETIEFNIDTHNLGQKLLKEFRSQMSGDMQVYFAGSNYFKIIGINDDIDFLVKYTNEGEKKKWKKILGKYFGEPLLEKNRFTKWETKYEGFPVEVLLSHPNSKIFQKMFYAYNALSDPDILVEYEDLKRKSVGISWREYNRRQMYFFDIYVKNKLANK